MARPNWLKRAVAKNDGYYSETGEKLKACRLTDQQVAAFNGKKEAKTEAPKKEEAPAPAPTVEVVSVEEVTEVAEETVTLELEVAEEAPAIDLEEVAEEVVEEAPAVAVSAPAPKKKTSRKKKK
jgi:uncharacterized caspase-like protein